MTPPTSTLLRVPPHELGRTAQIATSTAGPWSGPVSPERFEMGLTGVGWPQGIERTKGYVVARELEDVRAARTLEEVLESLQAVHSALDSLGIFEAVEINIDRSDAVLLQPWPLICDEPLRAAACSRRHAR